jgi:hypothetical protein
MPINNGQIRLLRPYLMGASPKPDGEWDLFCPLHHDSTRSASLNVYDGVWFCQAGCGGGSINDLIAAKAKWVAPNPGAVRNGYHPRGQNGAMETVTEAMVAAWAQNLIDSKAALDDITARRGLTAETLQRYEIGWRRDRKVYTIPVRGPESELLNVRFYTPTPAVGRRKMWGVTGRNEPRLYPIDQLDNETIVICEGEWDALITIQAGYAAITRTAAAKVWSPAWNNLLAGKHIFVCHDCDDAGMDANRVVGRQLGKVCDVHVINLPYTLTPKHGKDLTDFWLEHDKKEFEALLREAESLSKGANESEPEPVTVLDSFDSRRIAKPVNLVVTVKGKKEPGYTIPKTAQLSCTRDAGPKCAFCPMKATGIATVAISPDSPAVLALIDSPINVVLDTIRQEYGAMKCNKLNIEVDEHQSVEVLYARPSIDHTDGTEAGSYKTIRITSVGRHDTMPNNTLVATGALHPNPRSQSNEFLAWNLAPVDTSLDTFQLDREAAQALTIFQARGRPGRKLKEIAEAMGQHVTRIIGRWEMHAIFDLTLHSILSFSFNNKIIRRGWLQSIVYGDTRTGKSEAASQILRHVGAGEMVGGESASYAGLVGGLQQLHGREWIVTWGVIPLNDRRAVVVDEVTGLSHEDISHMSDLRHSGIVRIAKIQQEVTHARTRMLWLANPRDGGHMGQYTYGVDALRPLIGNVEDIARFDMAMAVTMHDVPVDEYNRPYQNSAFPYTSELSHQLLLWAWTRQVDQVVWGEGAEAAVRRAASELGRRYIEDPPLIQAADVREKIARLSVALAARLFSTDEGYQNVIVNKAHVDDAVKFINHIYSMDVFGYRERSDEAYRNREQAVKSRSDIRLYLLNMRGLAHFMRTNGSFRRQDIEEVMDMGREEANAVITKLWDARMVRKVKGDILVEPTLHKLLREVKF